LVTMNHASEKSKRESWRRGTGFDGEGKVDILIREIKLAMKNHISLSVSRYEMIWRLKVEIDRTFKVSQVTTSKSQSKSKSSCDNPYKDKKK
jgi:hypothetical protein